MAYNIKTGPVVPKKYGGAVTAPSKLYTRDEIKSMTTDYIKLTEEYFDHIPNGAHIRYVKKQKPGENKTPEERFKPGGFIQSHFVKDDKKFFLLGNKVTTKQGKAGDITFPVAYEDVQVLWKKYDYHAFVEIHKLLTSLKEKQKAIEELQARVTKLEAKLR